MRPENRLTDLSLIELNLRVCFRALASHRNHAETRRLGGIEVLSLGVRFQMFNAAFLAFPVEDDADFDRRLATAAVHFAARGLEWSFWLCDSLLPEAIGRRVHRALSRQGLTLATQMPGMIAIRLQSPERPLPECEVRPVITAGTLDAFRRIGARCFRVPLDWFSEVFDDGTGRRDPFHAWVGYAGGNPIATAATVTAGEAVGVYNVATLPEYRAQGYAEAIMRECIALEQNMEQAGDRSIVLQSTASGLALYERMGFQTVNRFRVWTS